MFIHLWDVHHDYLAPQPFDKKFVDPNYKGPVTGREVLRHVHRPPEWTDADVDHLNGLYDGEIAWTDDTIGRILDQLNSHGLKNSSVIVVTSDHGEAFFEHGFHGHRWSLHDEEVRIPLVVRYPSNIPPGMRVDRPTSIIDIAPTLLDFAGVPPLPHAMGSSLAPLLRDGGAVSEPFAICELTVPSSQLHLSLIQI